MASSNIERVLAEMQAAAERAVPDAMLAAAETVADEARANHPYIDRSHDLTDMTVPGAVTEHGNGVTAEVVGDTEYGGFVEEGTTRMAARPFLLPAYERREDEVARQVGEDIARAVP